MHVNNFVLMSQLASMLNINQKLKIVNFIAETIVHKVSSSIVRLRYSRRKIANIVDGLSNSKPRTALV